MEIKTIYVIVVIIALAISLTIGLSIGLQHETKKGNELHKDYYNASVDSINKANGIPGIRHINVKGFRLDTGLHERPNENSTITCANNTTPPDDTSKGNYCPSNNFNASFKSTAEKGIRACAANCRNDDSCKTFEYYRTDNKAHCNLFNKVVSKYHENNPRDGINGVAFYNKLSDSPSGAV